MTDRNPDVGAAPPTAGPHETIEVVFLAHAEIDKTLVTRVTDAIDKLARLSVVQAPPRAVDNAGSAPRRLRPKPKVFLDADSVSLGQAATLATFTLAAKNATLFVLFVPASGFLPRSFVACEILAFLTGICLTSRNDAFPDSLDNDAKTRATAMMPRLLVVDPNDLVSWSIPGAPPSGLPSICSTGILAPWFAKEFPRLRSGSAKPRDIAASVLGAVWGEEPGTLKARVDRYFRRLKFGSLAAAAIVILMLIGAWLAVANAIRKEEQNAISNLVDGIGNNTGNQYDLRHLTALEQLAIRDDPDDRVKRAILDIWFNRNSNLSVASCLQFNGRAMRAAIGLSPRLRAHAANLVHDMLVRMDDLLVPGNSQWMPILPDLLRYMDEQQAQPIAVRAVDRSLANLKGATDYRNVPETLLDLTGLLGFVPQTRRDAYAKTAAELAWRRPILNARFRGLDPLMSIMKLGRWMARGTDVSHSDRIASLLTDQLRAPPLSSDVGRISLLLELSGSISDACAVEAMDLALGSAFQRNWDVYVRIVETMAPRLTEQGAAHSARSLAATLRDRTDTTNITQQIASVAAFCSVVHSMKRMDLVLPDLQDVASCIPDLIRRASGASPRRMLRQSLQFLLPNIAQGAAAKVADRAIGDAIDYLFNCSTPVDWSKHDLIVESCRLLRDLVPWARADAASVRACADVLLEFLKDPGCLPLAASSAAHGLETLEAAGDIAEQIHAAAKSMLRLAANQQIDNHFATSLAVLSRFLDEGDRASTLVECRRLVEALDNPSNGQDAGMLAVALRGVLDGLGQSDARLTRMYCLHQALRSQSLSAGNVAALASGLSVQDLSEVLKWPLCAGWPGEVLLKYVEATSKLPLGGDVWKLVQCSRTLGIENIERPARPPALQDARGELRDLR